MELSRALLRVLLPVLALNRRNALPSALVSWLLCPLVSWSFLAQRCLFDFMASCSHRTPTSPDPLFPMVLCCGLCAASDAVLRPLLETIRRHEESVALLTARQTTLYRAYISERAAWLADTARHKAASESSASTIESLQAKVGALEEGLRLLSPTTGKAGDESAQRQQLTDHVRTLTRKIARLEANEPVLSRRYNLLLQEVNGSLLGG